MAERQLVPAAYYKNCVLRGGKADATANGTPYMEIEFDVPLNGSNVTRRCKLFLSDKAMGYTREKLAYLGFNGNFQTPSFTNTTGLEFKCEHKPRNDGTGNFEEWNLWAPRGKSGGGGKGAGLTSEGLARLNASWRAGAQSVPPPSAPAPAAVVPLPPGFAATPAVPPAAACTKQEAWERCFKANNQLMADATKAWEKNIAAFAQKEGRQPATDADWAVIAAWSEVPF